MRGKESRKALFSWSVCQHPQHGSSNKQRQIPQPSAGSIPYVLRSQMFLYSQLSAWCVWLLCGFCVCVHAGHVYEPSPTAFHHFLLPTQAALHPQPLSNYCQSGLERMLLQWRRSERRNHNEEVVLCREQAIVLLFKFPLAQNTPNTTTLQTSY